MRIAALLLALLLTTGTAVAQQSPAEGNWACVANIDGTKAGLLTVYGTSYGYASANYESAASGTGNVQLATDGVTFLDGNLVQGAGITVGLASIDANGRDTLTLHTVEKPVLTCILRSLTSS
jgi:hypothetical protein